MSLMGLTVGFQTKPLRKRTILSSLLGKLLLDDESLLRRLIWDRSQHTWQSNGKPAVLPPLHYQEIHLNVMTMPANKVCRGPCDYAVVRHSIADEEESAERTDI